MRLNITEDIKKKLVGADGIFENLVLNYADVGIELSGNYFESLAGNIVGQQLSNKVAAVILNRLVNLLGEVTAEKIIAADTMSLRGLGISYNKIGYLKNLSEAVKSGAVDLKNIANYSDGEIIRQLTLVKGIGNWTAEMFLIFNLGRPDIYALGDGGLYNAVKKLYKIEGELTKMQLKEITEKWSPYRSYASLYLWKSIDSVVEK